MVGARRRVTETEIEAGAHDALGLFDIDECRAQPRDLRREGNLAGAEIVKLYSMKPERRLVKAYSPPTPTVPPERVSRAV